LMKNRGCAHRPIQTEKRQLSVFRASHRLSGSNPPKCGSLRMASTAQSSIRGVVSVLEVPQIHHIANMAGTNNHRHECHEEWGDAQGCSDSSIYRRHDRRSSILDAGSRLSTGDAGTRVLERFFYRTRVGRKLGWILRLEAAVN